MARCAAVAVLTGGGGVPRRAGAQQMPMARLLVGFPPGGSNDIAARRLAEHLQGDYAASVLVENRPGASAQLAVVALRGSAPDGATLLVAPPAPFTIYPFTYKSLGYRLEDVQPLCLLCTFAFAFAVGPLVPSSARNLKDFLAWAKGNPDAATFGSPAAGSTPHLVGALLSKLSGVTMTHVPYGGGASGLMDLMSGRVAAFSSVLGNYLPHLSSGRIRILAISGAARDPFAPQMPTYREQGFPIDLTEWYGAFMPAHGPAETVARAASAVAKAVAHPAFVSSLADLGMTAISAGPSALTERLLAEREQWRVDIRRIGFSAES
jgi:tripartite-type tricarboxylate transporter receptor subunit TctC